MKFIKHKLAHLLSLHNTEPYVWEDMTSKALVLGHKCTLCNNIDRVVLLQTLEELERLGIKVDYTVSEENEDTNDRT